MTALPTPPIPIHRRRPACGPLMNQRRPAVGLDRERSRFYATRPRRVPPEFCTDEVLESCSLVATLLMYRLVSQADDQGRLSGSTRAVRATCFPMRTQISERKVAAAITELAEAGFVIRYEADGRKFLQVDRWSDLQGRWGRRAYPSRYPLPPGWSGDWVNVKTEDGRDEASPAASQVRAPGTQDATTLHTPITIPSPFSPSIPTTGLSSRTPREAGLGSGGASLGKYGGPETGRRASRLAIAVRSDR